MFKAKRVKYEETANLSLDLLSSLIVADDIQTIDETYTPQTAKHSDRKKGLDKTSIFYTELGKLLGFNVSTHNDTKTSKATPGMATTHNYLPLCFLAVRYNRRHIFQLLLNAFGKDIHLLEDGYLKGNILHHLYNEHSQAGLAMINDVFQCLMKRCSSEQILTLIDAKDKDECTVLMQAKIREAGELDENRPITADLERRIASLKADVSVLQAQQSIAAKPMTLFAEKYTLDTSAHAETRAQTDSEPVDSVSCSYGGK